MSRAAKNRCQGEEIPHVHTHTHARKAETPTAKRPTTVAATVVDVPVPLWLLVGVDWEPEPETVAWGVSVVADMVGYAPRTQGFTLCGDRRVAWALTAFGLDHEGLTVDVKLPPGKKRERG